MQSVGRICIAAVALVTLIAPAADAATSGGAYTTRDGISTQAQRQETAPATASKNVSTTPQPVCTYGVITDNPSAIRANDDGSYAPLYDSTHSSTDGSWQWKQCTDPAGNVSLTSVWIPKADPKVLAQQAISEQSLPALPIATNPAIGAGAVVNLPTWLWVDPNQWRAITATAAVDGFSVTATARPISVVWNMGDGKTVTCNGPGTAYDPNRPDTTQSSQCTYAYAKGSATQPDGKYVVTAAVQWQTTWRASDGTNGQLGAISRVSTTTLPVREIQAVNVAPSGGW